MKALVAKEDESTSPELEEKNEEIKIIPKMTAWAFVQKGLSSDAIPYILEVEEPIVSFHEIKEAPNGKKMIESFQDMVLKLLVKHNYRLLEKDGGKNH